MKKLLLCALLLSACSTLGNRSLSSEDDFLWLEEVEGKPALEFAVNHTDATVARLKADPNFAVYEGEVRKIALAKDRIPDVSLRSGVLYNFWQDEKNVRGLWRRTSVKSYRSKNPVWETVIDLDEVAKSEKENWVWKGAECLEPAGELCLLKFSRGGKDAVVVREFNAHTKSFVPNGFNLPEARSDVSWVNENEIFVGTKFDEDSVTESGYPRVAKRWKRGDPLEKAAEIFRVEKTDLAGRAYMLHRPEGKQAFLIRQISFFESEIFWLDQNEMVRLPMPASADFGGVFHGQLLYLLREELAGFPAGSLVALPLASARKGPAALADLRAHFEPTKETFLSSFNLTKDFLLLDVLDKVKGRVLRIGASTNWKAEPLHLSGNGMASLKSAENDSNFFLLSYTDFLTPTTFYGGDASKKGGDLKKLKSAPERFNAAGMVSEQWEALSKDGTRIPYFVVHKKNWKKNGLNPTLIRGYGGFEIPSTPYYSSSTGKVWLERGGVMVLANIRGGGEFGPAWHRAALKENRQKSFDDFIAVAEDLVKRNVTSPRHLGIQGGSNGGLLVGATFTQRPGLYNAVLCEVPLLDMLRYHRLLAGASWVGEYGSPDDPAVRPALEKYSPFQNVRADEKYPEVFFLTSTKDDRVHPGHARRMVAKMEAQGHKVLYYENTEGGHGGSANIEQTIKWTALEFTYLWQKLK